MDLHMTRNTKRLKVGEGVVVAFSPRLDVVNNKFGCYSAFSAAAAIPLQGSPPLFGPVITSVPRFPTLPTMVILTSRVLPPALPRAVLTSLQSFARSQGKRISAIQARMCQLVLLRLMFTGAATVDAESARDGATMNPKRRAAFGADAFNLLGFRQSKALHRTKAHTARIRRATTKWLAALLADGRYKSNLSGVSAGARAEFGFIGVGCFAGECRPAMEAFTLNVHRSLSLRCRAGGVSAPPGTLLDRIKLYHCGARSFPRKPDA